MDRTIALALITTVLAPVVGYLVFKFRARVEVEKRQDEAPLDLLKQAQQEIAQSRTQLYTFMNNHLEHDRMEREKLIEVLTEQKEAMKSISQDLIEHRQEERERTASFHERFNGQNTSMESMDKVIREKLAEIKGRLDARN